MDITYLNRLFNNFRGHTNETVPKNVLLFNDDNNFATIATVENSARALEINNLGKQLGTRLKRLEVGSIIDWNLQTVPLHEGSSLVYLIGSWNTNYVRVRSHECGIPKKFTKQLTYIACFRQLLGIDCSDWIYYYTPVNGDAVVVSCDAFTICQPKHHNSLAVLFPKPIDYNKFFITVEEFENHISRPGLVQQFTSVFNMTETDCFSAISHVGYDVNTLEKCIVLAIRRGDIEVACFCVVGLLVYNRFDILTDTLLLTALRDISIEFPFIIETIMETGRYEQSSPAIRLMKACKVAICMCMLPKCLFVRDIMLLIKCSSTKINIDDELTNLIEVAKKSFAHTDARKLIRIVCKSNTDDFTKSTILSNLESVCDTFRGCNENTKQYIILYALTLHFMFFKKTNETRIRENEHTYDKIMSDAERILLGPYGVVRSVTMRVLCKTFDLPAEFFKMSPHSDEYLLHPREVSPLFNLTRKIMCDYDGL
jgi:hypothetical protein